MKNKNYMKFCILGIFVILFISCISAMYAGENYSFSVPTTDNLTWDAVGNSSNMEGFSVFQEINGSESIITFSTVINMKPDNFTIILTSNKTNEVTNTVYVSSGHSHHTIIKHVNNTIVEYVEVPIENKTIEYIDKPNGIDITEISTNKIPFWIWIVLGLLVITLVILIVISLKRNTDDTNIDERRLKNNGK